MFKKAIVTGGLGFIGSHLVEKLLKDGTEVIVIDNLTNNCVGPDYFDVKVIIKSVGDVDFSRIKADVVFHLASILGPVGVLKHAGNLGREILLDTIKVRDYCFKNKALLVFVSTSEVYGQTREFGEESLKVYPGIYEVRTEYGAGKMLSEISVVNFAKMHPKFNYQIIRPFNVAGPRQRPEGGFVMPRFVIAALTNQPLTVYGDGKQKRGFTSVSDVVSAIVKVSECKFSNEIWNVGNKKNLLSIEDMARLVVKISMSSSKIIYVDPKKLHGKYFAEVLNKTPFAVKLKNKLNWEPKVTVEEIIRETVDYYRKKTEEGYKFKIL